MTNKKMDGIEYWSLEIGNSFVIRASSFVILINESSCYNPPPDRHALDYRTRR
jgi:hypothetical protein